ncbi:hypothetical protein [Caballeronia sp. LZ043]|uniref:hypothetical protein n=1 Tax=Caballeronia sp. LZ043 TaxID=3038569 RepID=UPI002861D82F|nr:hypothetical protein [Caballeronia sp. LZ043]MDR5823878.1 hypothetical protein [Caballeronia sp. LZ043]
MTSLLASGEPDMAVSSVSSQSSTPVETYDGDDNDTPATGSAPPDGSPAAPIRNEAVDAPAGQTGTPTSSSTLAQVQSADAAAPGLSSAETQPLLDRLDKDPTVPNDAGNANSLAALQGESLRGAPPDAISFEQQATQTNQQIEALPSGQRDFYRGALAAGSTYYNAATTGDRRAKIAQSVRSDVIDPVSKAYQQAMSDPNARVQQAFGKPFGAVYLGAAGQQQSDLLAEKGQQFNQATTPDERARIFGQAVDIRHTMQTQIGSMIDQEHRRVHDQWKQADQQIDQAMRDASSLQIASLGSLDDTRSFQRLEYFINHGLNSERNAQQFQYRLEHTPDDFKPLHQWSDEATGKAQWAIDHIQSDPFRRSAELPPLPPDPTHTTAENLRMGNFGADLLHRYQTENSRINEAGMLYHAASQRGPLRYEYLDAHTPPLPLWQQQLQDGLGRFFVGLVPGVNLLTDYIVPAKSLPEAARQGIDFFSGVAGGMLGEARLPRFGRAAEEQVPASRTKSEEAGVAQEVKPADEIKPVTAPDGGPAVLAASTAADAPGIPLVASEYARQPSGKLVPDADYRGLYHDGTGQHFIQQGGQSYPVRFDETAGKWQMEPRDGAPNAPHMSIDTRGNWQVDLDHGLVGGGKGEARWAFELYEQGNTLEEISRELHVRPETAKNLINQYIAESGEVRLARAYNRGEAPRDGKRLSLLYTRLTSGESLSAVAHELTGGDEFLAYISARRYARIHGRPIDRLPQELPWRTRPDGPAAASQPAPAASLTSYPMAYQQYADIIEGNEQLKPAWQISQETGVPTAWIERIRSGDGYWSERSQKWVALDMPSEPSGAGVSPPEPPLKRPSAYAGQSDPPPGTSDPTQPPPLKRPRTDGGEPSWGSKELRQFSEDYSKLKSPDANSMDEWFEGNTQAPRSLQVELTARGYQDITPDMVRTFMTGKGRELTTTQLQRIAEFLGV